MSVTDMFLSLGKQTRSGETVSLYYDNSGTRTIDAGQAAGTAVAGRLGYNKVLNSEGGQIATKNDTSLSFTGDCFTTERDFPYKNYHTFKYKSWEDKLEAVTAGFTNGQYCVDYVSGIIYGVKATTTASLTSTTYVINEVLSSFQYQDATFSSGQLTNIIGGEVDDPTALAARTEGDVGHLMFDLFGRLIVTKGTEDAGEDLAQDVQKTDDRVDAAISINADTQVSATSGILKGLVFSCNDAAPTAGSIDVYDALTATGNPIYSETFTTTPFRGYTVDFKGMTYGTGLYFDFTTTSDVNVVPLKRDDV